MEDASLPLVSKLAAEAEDATMKEAADTEMVRREMTQGASYFDQFDTEGDAYSTFRIGDSVANGRTRSGPGNSHTNFKIHGSGTVNVGTQ
jgi:hypothetical protein